MIRDNIPDWMFEDDDPPRRKRVYGIPEWLFENDHCSAQSRYTFEELIVRRKIRALEQPEIPEYALSAVRASACRMARRWFLISVVASWVVLGLMSLFGLLGLFGDEWSPYLGFGALAVSLVLSLVGFLVTTARKTTALARELSPDLRR